jgi:caffeoyl-CoA O-methyltransferase
VYDLAFIDADKPSYIDYYEELVPRVKPNGLILADNVLWIGRVVDSEWNDDDTVAIRQFNDHILADLRVEVVMVPISDGLTMVRKCD